VFRVFHLYLFDIIFKNKNAVSTFDECVKTANKMMKLKFYCRFPTLVLSRSGGSGAESAIKGMFSVSRGCSAE